MGVLRREPPCVLVSTYFSIYFSEYWPLRPNLAGCREGIAMTYRAARWFVGPVCLIILLGLPVRGQTKPTVVSTNPSNLAVNVSPLIQSFNVTFSKPMDTNYGVPGTNGWPIASGSWSQDKTVFTFTRHAPITPFEGGMTLTISLNPAGFPQSIWFRDTEGNFLDPYTFSFTFESGQTGLAKIAAKPIDYLHLALIHISDRLNQYHNTLKFPECQVPSLYRSDVVSMVPGNDSRTLLRPRRDCKKAGTGVSTISARKIQVTKVTEGQYNQAPMLGTDVKAPMLSLKSLQDSKSQVPIEIACQLAPFNIENTLLFL